jgi:hypothetical protein
MTRAEVLAAYNVNEKGIITSPGKFELAPVYVPYFWDCYMTGMVDEEDDEGNLIFKVTDEERQDFPELGDMEQIGLREEDSGFVRWYDATLYASRGN